MGAPASASVSTETRDEGVVIPLCLFCLIQATKKEVDLLQRWIIERPMIVERVQETKEVDWRAVQREYGGLTVGPFDELEFHVKEQQPICPGLNDLVGGPLQPANDLQLIWFSQIGVST